jgi:hypothetical protein
MPLLRFSSALWITCAVRIQAGGRAFSLPLLLAIARFKQSLRLPFPLTPHHDWRWSDGWWWLGDRMIGAIESTDEKEWTKDEIGLLPEIELIGRDELTLWRSNCTTRWILWGKATPIEVDWWSNLKYEMLIDQKKEMGQKWTQWNWNWWMNEAAVRMIVECLNSK